MIENTDKIKKNNEIYKKINNSIEDLDKLLKFYTTDISLDKLDKQLEFYNKTLNQFEKLNHTQTILINRLKNDNKKLKAKNESLIKNNNVVEKVITKPLRNNIQPPQFTIDQFLYLKKNYAKILNENKVLKEKFNDKNNNLLKRILKK